MLKRKIDEYLCYGFKWLRKIFLIHGGSFQAPAFYLYLVLDFFFCGW